MPRPNQYNGYNTKKAAIREHFNLKNKETISKIIESTTHKEQCSTPNWTCVTCNTVCNLEKEVHCAECCISYLYTESHCCDCGISWDSESKSHCFECCECYPKIGSHCCACGLVWNTQTHKHCDTCCVVYGNDHLHCCKCKSYYDSSIYDHCDVCCLVYNKKFSHCCSHGVYWSSHTKEHCCKCNGIYNKFVEHCCICKESEWCSCGEMQKKMHSHSAEFLSSSKINVANYKISPCLDSNCNAVNNFCKCLKQYTEFGCLEKMLIDDYVAKTVKKNASTEYNERTNKYLNKIIMRFFTGTDSRFKYVFHGTPSVSNAPSILCGGWAFEKRGGVHGQIHGTGEYFTSDINTAFKYAESNGCVILAIIPTSKKLFDDGKIKVVSRTQTETWYIVNNDETMNYCMPIGVIGKIDTDISCCTTCLKQFVRDNSKLQYTKVQYYDTKYRNYDIQNQKTILDNINKNLFVFDLTINDTKYKIDLNKMIQINTTSNYARNIRII